MTEPSFSDFVYSLRNLIKSFEDKNSMLKVLENPESDIIIIYGSNVTSLAKAKNGLDDVEELAFTTAEHHPYWSLLYHSSQISKIVLEKWEDSLGRNEISEIEWSIKKLEDVCKKIKEREDTD